MPLTLFAPDLGAQDTLIVNLSLGTADFSFGNQDGYDVIIPEMKIRGRVLIKTSGAPAPYSLVRRK